MASLKIASWIWVPAESNESPEYFCSALATSSRNCVRYGIPPGTLWRKDSIQSLKVLPVLVIPSAITSKPSTVL